MARIDMHDLKKFFSVSVFHDQAGIPGLLQHLSKAFPLAIEFSGEMLLYGVLNVACLATPT